jgi:hypothetical protein
MTQTAPYPQALADLVDALRYRQHLGWLVRLEDDLQRDKPGRHSGESRGLTLVVQRCGPDTYHPVNIALSARELLTALAEGQPVTELAAQLGDELDALRPIDHYFAVPPATFNSQSWMKWLFDRLGDVDTHERMEDFTFADPAVCDHDRLVPSRPCRACQERLTRPLAPVHGPGWDPYLLTVERTETDRRTSFRGVVDDDGTGHARVSTPVIGGELATELDRYRGRWVAVINQRVVADGESASEAEANVPGAVPGFEGPVDPLIFRVPGTGHPGHPDVTG